MKNATIFLEIHTVDPISARGRTIKPDWGVAETGQETIWLKIVNFLSSYQLHRSISNDINRNGTSDLRVPRDWDRLRCPNHSSLDLEIHDSQALTTTSHKEESDRGGNTAVFYHLEMFQSMMQKGSGLEGIGRDWQMEPEGCHFYMEHMERMDHACCLHLFVTLVRLVVQQHIQHIQRLSTNTYSIAWNAWTTRVVCICLWP